MSTIIDNVQLGKKIREFRLQAGLTQEKLAEELGITFQQVQKFEKGITKVNLVKLQQLASVLKVSVESFFGSGGFSAFQPSDNEKQLLTSFRKIKSADHQSSVIDIVSGLAKLKS